MEFTCCVAPAFAGRQALVLQEGLGSRKAFIAIVECIVTVDF